MLKMPRKNGGFMTLRVTPNVSYVMSWKNDGELVGLIQEIRRISDGRFFVDDLKAKLNEATLNFFHYVQQKWGGDQTWLLNTAVTLMHEMPSKVADACNQQMIKLIEALNLDSLQQARLLYIQNKLSLASQGKDFLAGIDWGVNNFRIQGHQEKMYQNVGKAIVKEHLPQLQEASDSGDPIAKTKLANCYANGWVLDRDINRALTLYEEASNLGYTEAQFRLGLCHYLGEGTVQNRVKAQASFKQANSFGHLGAETFLAVESASKAFDTEPEVGNLILNGIRAIFEHKVVEAAPFLDQAQKSLEKKETLRNAVQYMLGYVYEQSSIDSDAKQKYRSAYFCGLSFAIKRFDPWELYQIRLQAEDGKAKFQYQLGNRYLKGEGVNADESMAIFWLTKAATQGLGNAQCDLSELYLQKYRSEQTGEARNEAYKWAEMAIQSGLVLPARDIQAQLTPFSTLVQQAEEGNVSALYQVGYCYLKGVEVKANLSTAIEWWKKAAQNGDAYTQDFLAGLYREKYENTGNEDDLVEAYHYAQAAKISGKDTEELDALFARTGGKKKLSESVDG
jgi:TPR repeat protein